ncbi:MAG TPA: PEP-CTERM sorting domain-containing protein [Phycisphaerae bacterium]|nr:PEP-CTERM sorting domain-containing protein [Phycisphaerae bacterium]
MKKRCMGLVGSLAFGICGSAGVSYAGTVVVTPSNMNGWTLQSFAGSAGYPPVSSGPYAGTAQLVSSPAPPLAAPYGSGSAHLATNAGYGSGAEAITTDNFDGAALSAITKLSYWAYMANNGPDNNQQFPYLALAVSTDGNPIAPDGSNFDTLFFEPPYQTPSAGNPDLPDQGATVLDEWQCWNAQEGGWWDNDGIGNPGAPEGDNPGVISLATYLETYPDATIIDPGDNAPGFGGVTLQVGFADNTSVFDGNVDDFTFGTDAGSTTYAFEAPEPASLGVLAIGGLGLLMKRKRKMVSV